ncbi:MAG: hypothetical protein Q9198_008520 [Flavoplaca austrocitrina]
MDLHRHALEFRWLTLPRNNKGPKAATAAKSTANGAGTRDSTRGRGRGGRRGRNAGRAKPKTADELDAEMTDYFDTNAANAAGTDGVATNGAVQPVANGADDLGMDEISLSYAVSPSLPQASNHHATNSDLTHCISLQPFHRSWLRHESELECSHDHRIPSPSSTTYSPKPPKGHEHASQLSATNPYHVIVTKPNPAYTSSSSSARPNSGRKGQQVEASGYGCLPAEEYLAWPYLIMPVGQD